MECRGGAKYTHRKTCLKSQQRRHRSQEACLSSHSDRTCITACAGEAGGPAQACRHAAGCANMVCMRVSMGANTMQRRKQPPIDSAGLLGTSTDT
jgi:hypothetical protein